MMMNTGMVLYGVTVIAPDDAPGMSWVMHSECVETAREAMAGVHLVEYGPGTPDGTELCALQSCGRRMDGE